MSTQEPSLDAYTKLKDELVNQIINKNDIDVRLAALEEEIYEKELDYFNESTYGNIVKGFESFGKMSLGGSNKRKMMYSDEEHIFSMSSATFIKTLMMKQGVDSGTGDLDEYEDSVEPITTGNGVVNGTGNENAIEESPTDTPLRKRK